MEPIVTEEIIARQAPKAQAIIRLLLARVAALEAEVEELQRQLNGKTPQNSSLPPSAQHPHAKPPRKKGKSKKRRGGQSGPRLMAFTALLMAFYRQSKRRTADFLSALLGQPSAKEASSRLTTRASVRCVTW